MASTVSDKLPPVATLPSPRTEESHANPSMSVPALGCLLKRFSCIPSVVSRGRWRGAAGEARPASRQAWMRPQDAQIRGSLWAPWNPSQPKGLCPNDEWSCNRRPSCCHGAKHNQVFYFGGKIPSFQDRSSLRQCPRLWLWHRRENHEF
jgi:hypothetical protein